VAKKKITAIPTIRNMVMANRMQESGAPVLSVA
jgi:hypothetical protein